MRYLLILFSVFAFLVLLGAAFLTGFEIVDVSRGIPIAIASFLLGAVSVGAVFSLYGPES